MPVVIATGSDDSIQVYIQEDSVHVNSIARAWGAAGDLCPPTALRPPL